MKLLKILTTVTVVAVVVFFSAYGLGIIGGDEIKKEYEAEYSGFHYTGVLRNGRFTGNGMMDFDNGCYYYGGFSAGRFNGEGTYTDSNNFIFEGYFKEGQVTDGIFKYYKNDISYSRGQIDDRFSNGKWVYNGKLVNGYAEGYGKYISPEGWTYEGEFKNGKFDGIGVLNIEGEVIRGLWSEGIQVAGYED